MEKLIKELNNLRPTKEQVKDKPAYYAYGYVDAINSAIELVKNNAVSPLVSASTVIKELHEALKNLLQAADDEGWHCDGKDWEEQEQARRALANVPKKYLR